MRIIPKKPVQIINSIVQDHLKQIWIRPDEMLSILETPNSTTTPTFFTDNTFVTRIDPSEIATRLVLSSGRTGERKFQIVASIMGPENDTGVLLVTDTAEIVLAMHSGSAVHPDGTVQIHGAEPSIIIFTLDQAKQHVTKKRALVRGGVAIRELGLETRDTNGIWVYKPWVLRFPQGSGGTIQLD